MRRREFLSVLGGGAAAWPLAARAQRPGKVPRIGYLVSGSLQSAEHRPTIDAFRQGLRQLGYVEGQSIVIEFREAHGRIEKFSTLAAELVREGVDLILAPNSTAARAARQATATIPIVGFALADAIGDGLVASLARPGGNVTGMTFIGPELAAKRLELLKDIVPAISRVTALWHIDAFGERTTSEMLKSTESTAAALGLQLQTIGIRSHAELDGAFATIVASRTEGVLVFPSPLFFSGQRLIADLALRHRLPSTFVSNEFVQLGGLFAYGADLADLARRSAIYVEKILKGAKPADLPVEQPTKFVLSVNLRTAKALGLEVPPTLLARADEVIE